jgi:hypothetical protein
LVNDGFSGACLLVVTKRVSGGCQLAFFYGLFCGHKMLLEQGPGFIGHGFIVPFSDVACKNGRSGNGKT